MVRWTSLISPRSMECWFAAGCCAIACNLDWWTAAWANKGYLEPLLNPSVPILETAALLIAISLSAKNLAKSALATDALLATLSDARMNLEKLSNALIVAAQSRVVKFSRWVKTLNQVASTSPAIAKTIFQAIEGVIASDTFDDSPDFGKLLELQLELKYSTGLALTNPRAIQYLSTLKAGGKTRIAARRLLEA
ncbi:MAG: hypothetical protein FJW36_05830 [Acidobacteria bacterium]|nr:hypothetical protein [Acidobacteriota bacterium]